MTTSFLERELKFDIPAAFTIPDVSDLLPEGGAVDTTVEELRSDYFDTADHALDRASITLRRRTGSTDNGWQLKIPQPPFREEIRVEQTDDDVPTELRRLLLGVVRDRDLIQIATIRTQRSVTRLLDQDGNRLAEIDDDTVQTSVAGAAATVGAWREVEVELGTGEERLLHALGKRLRRAGARVAAKGSKLARALPDAERPSARRGGRKGKPSVATVLAGYVTEQRRVVLAGDIALRRGDEGVIHKTRVASRRLRSTLRTYSPYVDAERAAFLDGELRWYAALLGDVRDRQVLRERLDGLVAQLPDELRLGPVQARIDDELRREQADHWRVLQNELTGLRYQVMLADLEQWVQSPPWSAAANGPARVLARSVTSAERRVARRLDRANATGDVHRLHGARKAAKRARYAAEAAEPVIGAHAAKKHARRYQKLQDLLGEHQDSLVSAAFLRRIGAKAGTTANENGFSFGILCEREHRQARDVRAQAQRVARKYR